MSAIKEAVVELANNLPEDCTWDDVMYQVYVRQKIDAGIKDADEGRLAALGRLNLEEKHSPAPD
jgi:hypothetical protein